MLNPKKIMIFGRPGSGKTTFAYALHQATKLPLHHLDQHFFKANWIERDYQEFLKIQQSIVDQEFWIIDGNSTKSLEMRFSRADLVLYFNFQRWICYLRTVKRLFYPNHSIQDCAEGCKKNIRFVLLKYMWSFEDRVARQLALLKKKYPHVQFMELTSSKDSKNLAKLIGFKF